MTLSRTERAMLSNQFRILEKLTPNEYEAQTFSYKAEILEEGYERLYDDALSLITVETHPEQEGQELFDILNMYRHIRNSIKLLNPSEVAQLNLNNADFQGLDANNDSQYSFLEFVVKNGKYSELADSNLNSHSMINLPKYRQMLSLINSFGGVDDYNRLPFLKIKQLTDIV